jgi:hypothetical protein
MKANACRMENYTLIVIPFSWDRSLESIQQIIQSERPDLFPRNSL